MVTLYLIQHWGIPLSRRFRSLKLWFVIRNFGVSGLQEYVRNHCRLAKKFEALVEADNRFRVMNDVKVMMIGISKKFKYKMFEGWIGLLQTVWIQPAEPEVVEYYQCLWKVAHGVYYHPCIYRVPKRTRPLWIFLNPVSCGLSG